MLQVSQISQITCIHKWNISIPNILQKGNVSNYMIEKINRINVVDYVFESMMNMIASGEWKVGDKIPSENELSEKFNVSRNSIRQAIHRISALGLLKSVQGEGTYVNQIDLSFYMNILIPHVVLGTDNAIMLFQLQRAIQVESAHLVCENRSDEEARRLLELVDQMKEYYKAKDETGYLNADLDYHSLFAEMTRNTLFVKLTDIIRHMLYYTLRDVVLQFDCVKSISFHENIAKAIIRRDRQTVIELMEGHMDDVIEMIANLHTSENSQKKAVINK